MTGPTIDIAGAARATGLSVKAIRGRVERGSLPAELVGGRRRIPVRALLDAGLLVDDPTARRGADPLERLAGEIAALREEVARLADRVERLAGGSPPDSR